MGKIIACIDGSGYTDSVCNLSVWVTNRNNLDISLLHVATPHFDVAATGDLSGQIGLGAKNDLLKELTKIDEAHGKLEQKKGQLMLDHAKKQLAIRGVKHSETLHRRGSLTETIVELEPEIDFIIMGKNGSLDKDNDTKLNYSADFSVNRLGSNLESVIRAIHKPLLVAIKEIKPINRFLIAYDGSPSAQIALDYVVNNPLLKGLECHLLKVGESTNETEALLKQAEEKLKAAGFLVHTTLKQGKAICEIITDYITSNAIDLLVIGAYGHSKIRSLILGSITRTLIHQANIPILLFR